MPYEQSSTQVIVWPFKTQHAMHNSNQLLLGSMSHIQYSAQYLLPILNTAQTAMSENGLDSHFELKYFCNIIQFRVYWTTVHNQRNEPAHLGHVLCVMEMCALIYTNVKIKPPLAPTSINLITPSTIITIIIIISH